MSRAGKKKGYKNRLPPFVPIFIEELESKAYHDLKPSAAKALVHFKRIDGKVKRLAGDDYNGLFDFTYSEAERLGFAKSTFSGIISELVEKGFIEVVKVGGLRGAGLSNSKYKLSSGWKLYGLYFKPKPRWPTEP